MNDELELFIQFAGLVQGCVGLTGLGRSTASLSFWGHRKNILSEFTVLWINRPSVESYGAGRLDLIIRKWSSVDASLYR